MKLWRRQLTQEPILVVTVVAAVLLAAVFVAAIPRLLEHASQQDLEQAIVESTPEKRNIRLQLESRLGSGSLRNPFNYVRRQGELRREKALPQSVDRLIGAQYFLVDTPRFRVSSFPDQIEGPFPTTFHFRYQEGIEDELVLAEGAMPGITEPIAMFRGTECPPEQLAPPDYEVDDEVDCVVDEVPVFETAVTVQTAQDMSVTVGDSLMLTPNFEDPQWHLATPPRELRLVLVISGIIELSDPDLEYWYGDSALHRPRITENPDFRIVGAAGLFRPDRYLQLLREVPSVGNNYTWRYLVTPDRIVADQAEVLAVELSKISGGNAVVTTQLPELLRDFVDQRTITVSLLSTVTASLAVVTISLVGVIALLLRERQRSSSSLLVDRGASRLRQVATVWLTSLVLVLPAIAAGWVVAWRLLPDTDMAPSLAAVFWLAVTACVGVVLALGPLRLFRSLGAENDGVARRVRRIVFELVIVIGAVAASVLVRRRALDEAASDLLEQGDPLVALVPILVLLAVCVLLARLLGPALGGASKFAVRRRGIIGFLSLRRAADLSLSARSPVLAVVVSVAVAVLSATVGSSIGQAQSQHAVHIVGADFRIEARLDGVPLPDSVDPTVLGSGTTWAFGTTLSEATVIGESGGAVADLIAIEAASYADIMESTGRDSGALGSLASASSTSSELTGEAETPIGVIVSRAWPGSVQPEVGDALTIKVGGNDLFALVIAVVEDLVGVSPNHPGVLVDLDQAAEFLSTRQLEPRFLYINAPGNAAPRLEQMAVEDQGAVRLFSRQDVRNDIAGDPFAAWMNRVLWIVAAAAVGAGVVAVAAGVAMSASARRRDIAMLHTLGLTPSQSAKVAVIEQLPSVVVAVVVGFVSGVSIAYLLEPALDIGTFAAGTESSRIVIDASRSALLAAALIAAMTITITIAELQQRGSGDAKLLRVGDES